MFQSFKKIIYKYRSVLLLGGSMIIIPVVILQDSKPSTMHVLLGKKLIEESAQFPKSLISRQSIIEEIESLAKSSPVVVYDPTRSGKTLTMLALRESAVQRRAVLMVNTAEIARKVKDEFSLMGSTEAAATAISNSILMASHSAVEIKPNPLMIFDQAEKFEDHRYPIRKFLKAKSTASYSLVFCTNDLSFYYNFRKFGNLNLYVLPPLDLYEFTTVCQSQQSGLSKQELANVAREIYQAVGPNFGIAELFFAQESSQRKSIHILLADLEEQYFMKLQKLDQQGLRYALDACLNQVSDKYPLGCTFLGFEFGASLVSAGLGREDVDGMVSFLNPLVLKAAKRVQAMKAE